MLVGWHLTTQEPGQNWLPIARRLNRWWQLSKPKKSSISGIFPAAGSSSRHCTDRGGERGCDGCRSVAKLAHQSRVRFCWRGVGIAGMPAGREPLLRFTSGQEVGWGGRPLEAPCCCLAFPALSSWEAVAGATCIYVITCFLELLLHCLFHCCVNCFWALSHPHGKLWCRCCLHICYCFVFLEILLHCLFHWALPCPPGKLWCRCCRHSSTTTALTPLPA